MLATSCAPELRRPELRPKEHPRTDYVELSRVLDCDIVDYAIYDGSRAWSRYRSFERRLRLDFHLALVGYRRARKYDVVLLMSELVAIPFMMLQKLMGRRAATVYVSAHSSGKQAKLVRSLGLFGSLDIAVSNTHAQRDFFVQEMRIPEDRIRYVLYAADEQFYTPAQTASQSDFVFSAGGVRGRDYPVLFEAVRGLPVRVRIAAGGRLYALGAARELPPLPENVELLPHMDSAAMRELYRQAAVVAVPVPGDRKDAAGCSVVLEGMACAKPVIASGTSGMGDYISSEETGLLAGPGDSSALRDAIVSALDSPELRATLGRRARAESETRLSLARLVSGLADAVEEAAG